LFPLRVDVDKADDANLAQGHYVGAGGQGLDISRSGLLDKGKIEGVGLATANRHVTLLSAIQQSDLNLSLEKVRMQDKYPSTSCILSSQKNHKRRLSTSVTTFAEVAAFTTPQGPSFGLTFECEPSCDDFWIYPKKFAPSRSRICRIVQKSQKSARESAKVRSDSKLRGSSRQNKFLLLAEEEEEEEEEVEESLGSLVVKKKTKKKKKKKKKKKRKLDGGAASKFFITTSNFFEGSLKAVGGERESTNMSRCETRTEKGKNGGGM
jgi:hypothetical protein